MSLYLISYFLVLMLTALLVVARAGLAVLCWLARDRNPWARALAAYFTIETLAAGFLAVTEFMPDLQEREIRASVYRGLVSLGTIGLSWWLIAWLLRRHGEA